MNSFFARFLTQVSSVAIVSSGLACASLIACSSSSSGGSGTADSGHDAHKDSGTATVDTGVDAGMDVTTVTNTCDAGSYDAAIAVEAGQETWSSLYRDYFGPSGVASCAGNGNCHGSMAAPGYAQSGFLCPTGDASTDCWQGITSQGPNGADIITPDAGFLNDQLSETLCTECGLLGEMPKGCTYSFTPYDMARIGNWVNAGAQNN